MRKRFRHDFTSAAVCHSGKGCGISRDVTVICSSYIIGIAISVSMYFVFCIISSIEEATLYNRQVHEIRLAYFIARINDTRPQKKKKTKNYVRNVHLSLNYFNTLVCKCRTRIIAIIFA